jgi:amino acid permease
VNTAIYQPGKEDAEFGDMNSLGLKRVLGFPTATFIAIGFTIGGGVFIFTGIVFRIVGPALPMAYDLSGIPVFISMMPVAMLGSALPVTGGNYLYPSRLVSPALAFVGIWIYALAAFFGQIPLYALGCAKYAQVFFPDLSPVLFALAIVPFFYPSRLRRCDYQDFIRTSINNPNSNSKEFFYGFVQWLELRWLYSLVL